MASTGTVNDQDQAFMVQYLKSLKFEAEHAATSAAKQQAIQKADVLRTNAKAMGIDLSAYGPNVLLANTPGGNVIDWNLLSSTGKAWAGLNPTDEVSTWKQSVGTGLVSNLSGYQADYASFADSAAYDTVGAKTKMAQPTMWQPPGTGAVNPVISGSNVGALVTPPTVVTPPVVPPASVTPNRTTEGLGQMQASQATALQANRPIKPVEPAEEGMEWTQPSGLNGAWEQTPIKSQGVVDAEYDLTTNEGMLAAFLKDNAGVNPDNTQWDQPTVDRFKNWATLQIQKSAQQGIIDQGENYDPTKDPLWSAYAPLIMAQNDLSKQSLKTALDLKVNAIQGEQADIKANYDFQVAEIQNAISMANWSSRETMAVGSVVMMGALSWALQANEAEGINKIWVSIQERTNGLNKLSQDINILTQDYLSTSSLMDQKAIAEIGVKRLELIEGNSKEVQVAKLAIAGLDAQIAATNIAAPGTQKATEATLAAASEQVDFERAATMGQLDKAGVFMQTDASGHWTFKTGLTADQKLNQDKFVLDNFIQRQANQLNWAQLDLDKNKQKFYEWATKAGLAMDQKQLDETWAELAGAMTRAGWKKDAKGNWAYSGEGQATDTTNTAGAYDPTEDRNLVNSDNFQASGPGSLPYLRLGAYSGAMTGTDTGIESFVLGGTSKAVVKLFDANGKPSLDANGQQKTKQVDMPFTGLKDLAEGDARDVIGLIQDPLRAGEAWAMWCGLNVEGTTTAGIFRAYAAAIDPTTGKPQLTTSQLNAGLKFLSTWRTTPGQGGGQP